MNKKILVSGLLNIETSLEIDSFPINYSPIEYPFFGVNSVTSGVGYNIAKALKTLGDDFDLLSIIGNGLNGDMIISQMKKEGIDTSHIFVDKNGETAQSVVLVDKSGRRKIYCDLKDLQDKVPFTQSYIDITNYSLLILTNINFNRELVKHAHTHDIEVATDVHVLSDLNDSYNIDFMANADILFLSNESILGREEEFIKTIHERYHNKIIVCGLGEKGALMHISDEDRFFHEPAVAPFGVKSTLGAGDALFSSFLHFYLKGYSYEKCLRFAVIFAGIKISSIGGSNGFADEETILNEYKKIYE